MPSNFGSTPLSTTALSTNQFPVSAGFVPNTAGGNLTSIQLGPASTDSNSYTSAPIATYTPDGNDLTQGLTTDSAVTGDVSGTLSAKLRGLSKIFNAVWDSTHNRLIVDGSQVTQPVSGTLTVNAGTNLNTSALALDTSVNGVLVAQGSTTSGEKGPLIQGAVTTNAPSYTTAQTSPLSLDTSGLLRASLKDTPSNTNNLNVNLAASAVTQTVSGTITANAGTNLNTSALALDTSVNGVLVSQGSTTSGEKGPLIQGAVTTASPSYTTAQTSPLSLTTAGALRVDGSSVTQPVSGTVTANAGTNLNTSALALESGGNLASILAALDDGQETMANSLSVVIASDQTAIPIQHGSLVDASNSSTTTLGSNAVFTGTSTSSLNYSALSLEVFADQASAAGGLSVQQSQNGTNWDIADTFSISASTAFNTVVNLIGQFYRVVYTNGGTAQGTFRLQTIKMVADPVLPRTLTTAGALRVDGSATTQPVSGTITANAGTGTFTIQSNASVNINQIAGSAVSTAATGVQKVGIVGNAGAVMDAAGQNASSPANELLVAGQFNTTPTTITSGNVSPLQLDASGNLLVNIKVGGGTGGTSSNFNSAFPSVGTAVGASDGTNMKALLVDASGFLKVNVAAGSGSGFSAADETAWTAGTTNFVPAGGVFNDSAAALTSGQEGTARVTNNRAIHVNLRDASANQLLGSKTSANSIPVVIASDQGAYPVSQSGSNWSVNFAQIAGTTASVNTGNADAGTQRVVLASNQPDVPIKGDFVQQTSLSAGSLNADLVASTDISAYGYATITVTGTWTGTLTSQYCDDNATFAAYSSIYPSGATAGATITANGQYVIKGFAGRYLRIRMTAYTSGTANATLTLYTLTNPLLGSQFVGAGQQGTWTVQPGNTANTTPWLATINQGGNSATVTASNALKVDGSAVTQPVSGTVTANQGGAPWSDNITQFGGNNVATGTGASGSGIPRVTVSNDSEIQLWDGTNGPVAAKAANTSPVLADKALVQTISPNNTGLPVNLESLVQKTSNVSSGSVASLAKAFGSNNAQGNSIVVVCAVGNGTAPTISDTNSNSYTQEAQIANGTALNVAIFLAVNIASGANTVTVNNGGSTASIAMEIYEVSGILASIPNQPDGTATNTGSSGTASTSTINPASPNEYAFAAIGVGTAAQTITVGSGWTNDSGQQNPTTPAGLFSFVSMSQFLGSLKAVTPQATFTSEPWAIAVATFRPVILGVEGSVKLTDGTVNFTAGSKTSANSFPVVIASDQGNVATNVAQFGGTNVATGTGASGAGIPRVTVSNDSTIGANSATGSAVPANAFYQGGLAKTALPTAATDGNLTGEMLDKFGRQVVLPNAMRDLVSPLTQLTLTSTTTETTLITAVASTFLDIVSLVIINTSATATQVDFRDSTAGTIRLSAYVPPTDMRGISYTVPLPQSTVNNNWTAKCGTSVASVIITGSYISNK